MIYERRHVPPIPPMMFAVRMARHVAAAGAFIAVTGLLLAPVVHRVLHHFHWEGERSR